MPKQLPEGTVIVQGVIGSIVASVQYPYRKTPDAYLCWNEGTGNKQPCSAQGWFITCLQCDTHIVRNQYAEQAWITHIRRHDRRKKVQAMGR